MAAVALLVSPAVVRLGGSSSDVPFPQAQKPRTYVFIVNPEGGSGKTLKRWKAMKPLLQRSLGEEVTVREALTEYPFHAAELAREAVEQGADAVVAVGGDGTLHEPVIPRAALVRQEGAEQQRGSEGEEQQSEAGRECSDDDKPRGTERNGCEGTHAVSRRPALGVIPLGTGSDFARTFGWRSDDANAAVARIARGHRQAIDVGRVQLRDCGVDQCFVNVADVHLSARVGRAAVPLKSSFGSLCYAIATLKAFPKHRNLDLSIRIDNGPWQTLPAATMLAIGNANFFGGGMRICPQASPSSGSFNVVTLSGFRLLDFVQRGWRLFAGSHIGVKGVESYSAKLIEIKVAAAEGDSKEVSQEVYVQGDGEALGHLPAVFQILPGAIDILV
ncbi:hypothetical protein CLOM_g20877 [Closterium sp. NIES-68]|nr:hypothetical protein CLOM_g20877 [Closterium sp. NIES-68]GJP68501.1 hypothetical protein CLOP_g25199 [Closterium sp. NIES-67]